MTRVVRIAVLAFLLSLQLAFAAQPAFQPGKILKLERKTRSRVLYYMVHTPITLEDPYYDVSVQLKQTIYMAEYEPRHSEDALPDQWSAGETVSVKIEKRHMILKSSGTAEYTTIIVKHWPATENSHEKTENKTP